jgi:outer membrane protein assembly factor BamB
VLPAPGAEKHWPRFRGPTGQGDTNTTSLPSAWDNNGTNVRWRVKVPGKGNSSPITWGERLFLTSSSEDGAERSVLCFRLADGELLWNRPVPAKPPERGVRDKNGYASATPVTDGERVISFLGSCGLVCHDFEGKQIWQYSDFTIRSTHGVGSSPVLYKDLVILCQDQNQADSIFLALDKRTGEKIWQEKRAKAMTWNTPVVLRVGDRDELIAAGGKTVKGYDPLTGKELWSLAGPTEEVIPTIVIGKNLMYSASGRNGPTIAMRLGGKGDVTKSALVWRAVRGGPHVPSPILVNGRLYTANDTGIVTCLHAATGELLYQERIDDRFSASPIASGDRIYVSGESGVTYILKASEDFEVLAKNDLSSPILASPAVVGNDLILRTQEELVRVQGGGGK